MKPAPLPSTVRSAPLSVRYGHLRQRSLQAAVRTTGRLAYTLLTVLLLAACNKSWLATSRFKSAIRHALLRESTAVPCQPTLAS